MWGRQSTLPRGQAPTAQLAALQKQLLQLDKDGQRMVEAVR